MLRWANAKVAAQSGLLPVTKLSDATLASGVYVLTLIKAVAPRSVDLAQVTSGATPEDKKLNARLAISCARRAGCMIFALWEDIVECKPKMLLVMCAVGGRTLDRAQLLSMRIACVSTCEQVRHADAARHQNGGVGGCD